jgi:hypothetical protein
MDSTPLIVTDLRNACEVGSEAWHRRAGELARWAWERYVIPSPLTLHLAPDAITPLVRQIVREALAQLEEARAALPDKLAYSEAEAATLLSLAPHQLRDERLRGRIKPSLGPGRRILYTRQQLLDYLRSREWQPGSECG